MAKQIIIDWQTDGLIVASGSARGGRGSLDKLSFQPIGGEGEVQNSTAEQALHRAVTELGISKGDVTVIAARNMVEVRTVSVPQIDADELPDVIRFQAQSQLANMGETWPLDFVLLPREPGQEMQTALVGVISPAHVAAIDSICAGAGLNVAHIGLRPLEIARFAIGEGAVPQSGVAMMIAVTKGASGLMILKDGKIVQIRETNLPSQPEEIAGALKGEMRRSIMAASNHLAETPIQSVVLLASSETGAKLRAAISEVTDSQAVLLDPANIVPSGLENSQQLVEHAGHRIAALAGATTLTVADKALAIDFKNPKKRPPKKKNTRTYILAAAAAFTLLCGAAAWWYSKNAALDSELETLLAEKTNLKELVEKPSQDTILQAAQLESFLAQSPNWLDELAYISQRIPSAQKVQIFGTGFNMTPQGEGRITIANVLADDTPTIKEFEASLQDEHHEVISTGVSELPEQIGNYAWKTSQTITIKDRGWRLMDNFGPQSAAPAKQDPKQDSTADEPDAVADATEGAADTTPEAAGDASETEAPPEDEAQDPAPEARPEDAAPADASKQVSLSDRTERTNS